MSVLNEAAAGEPVTHFEFTRELVTLGDTTDKAVVAIETLANAVITRVLDPGRRGLAVCGPSSGVGVTFTAANLALILSQAGVSTLLIDANMRRPRVQSIIIPPAGTPGLAEYLRSGTFGDELVCAEVSPNLSVIYAGEPASDAAELVAGDAFADLIQRCMRDFTLTIVDTPPANRWADARSICRLMNYVLVVAQRDVSFMDDVATLTQELETDGVSVVATILNQA